MANAEPEVSAPSSGSDALPLASDAASASTTASTTASATAGAAPAEASSVGSSSSTAPVASAPADAIPPDDSAVDTSCEAADGEEGEEEAYLDGSEVSTELFHLYRQTGTAFPGVRANERNWHRLFGQASGDVVPTIALLGDTRSGKSFIINRMLLPDESGPLEAGDGTLGSTTCDVHLYSTMAFESVMHSKLQFLDFEGENGSGITRQVVQQIGHMAALFNRPTDANDRRILVQKYFPKMAFLLSDIVVLIGMEDLTNHRYFRRCQEFAACALQSVSDLKNPYLLLVQNKVSTKDYRASRSIDLTQQFLDVHKESGSDVLRNQFAGIACLKVPMLEESLIENPKYDFDPESEPEFICVKTDRIFNEAMLTLKNVIVDWGTQINSSMTSMTNAMWFQVSKCICESISFDQKPISVASIQGMLAQIDDEKVSQVVKYFGLLYEHVARQSDTRPEQYRFCRRQAFDLACRIYVVQVLDVGGKRTFRGPALRQNFKEYYDKVLAEITKFEPCVAVNEEWRREDRTPGCVHCWQSKESHGDHAGHRAWESVEPETFWHHLEKLVAQVVGQFNGPITMKTAFNPSWGGRFSEGDGRFKKPDFDFLHEFEELCETLEELMKGPDFLRSSALARMKETSAALGQDGIRALCMPHVVLGSCMVCAKEYDGDTLRIVPTPLRRKLFAVCPDCLSHLQDLEPGDEAGMWEDRCCICLQDHADVIFIPCGHICTCSVCFENMPRRSGAMSALGSGLGNAPVRYCPQDRKVVRAFVTFRP